MTSTRISLGNLARRGLRARIVPPSGVNLTALARRLIRTSAILLGSTSIEPTFGIDLDGDGLLPQLEVGRELVDDALGDRPQLDDLGVERLAEVAISDQLEHAVDGPRQPAGGGADAVDPLALDRARRSGLATSSRGRSCPARRSAAYSARGWRLR